VKNQKRNAVYKRGKHLIVKEMKAKLHNYKN